MKRRLRWEHDPAARPRRPYRDTAILHLVLAALIVVFALVTGGSLARALVWAAAFFVAATAWSYWRWRERLAAERRRPR